MPRRVLWLLICSLLTTAVRGVDNCLPSREAYVNLNLGDAEDVPEDFVSGVDANICVRMSLTCCPLDVEKAIENAAFGNTRNMMPPFSLYLNESDRVFFIHYDFVRDVVVEAIRDYFELSIPANVSNIQSTMNRMTRQLNNVHLMNSGSNFPDRMKDLFSYSYLERMKGLYNFGPNDEYSEVFTRCALPIIEQEQISDEITSAINVMEYHFRSLYYFTEILFSIHSVFLNMEGGLPFVQCVRSFAELFYCHICLPETSSLFPCRNVCKNVISGCTIFLHVIGEEMIEPLRAACQLNTMTNHPVWNLHTALETLNNELYSIFDTRIGDLLQIASSVSSCDEVPQLANQPTPTDNPHRTMAGRDELLSVVPTSLTQSLHYTLMTNLSSMFLGFENITENILESECGNFSEDDGSPNFECWHRMSTSTTDVNFLGIDFQAVLYDNQDLEEPDATFVNNFNASIDYMKANVTQAMRFIRNAISANMQINVDHCNLPLEQLVLPPPVVPTTTIIANTNTINVLPSTTTFNAVLPTVINTRSSDAKSRQTGIDTTLVLLLSVLSIDIIFSL